MSKTVRSQQVSATSSRAVPGRRPLAQWIAAALAMGAMHAHAGAPPLSQAWLAGQRANAAPAPNPAAAGMPDTSGLAAQTSGQLLQQRVVQQSIANLNNAAAAVAAQLSAQQAAQQAAQQLASPVPDGIAAGGLQVAAGAATHPLLWQNANAPVQTLAAGKTTVQVKQTAQKAILTWDSFNIGRNTTLYFNQSGGTQSDGSNNWIALNRIQDPSGSPSQIFGQIKAEGTVYLLNRNGILFGSGSQVNTGSFLASSLNLLGSDVATSNAAFLAGGINSPSTINGFLFDGAFTDGRNHDVVIQKGASITTGPQGFALIAAPNVSNAGSVIADDGQAILAAGAQFSNASAGSPLSSLQVYASDGGRAGQPYIPGTVTNTGLVQSRRGQVHMLGYNVNQAGVALASTSISYPGSIELNAADRGGWNTNTNSVSYQYNGSLVLAPGSVTAILPEKDGSTTSSTAAANTAFKSSRLSLSGGMVTLQSNALLEAPSASLSLTATLDNNDTRPTAGRIYIDNGAVVDVSGLADVNLPMSALLVSVPRIGQNELADSPLLRNSFLYTQKNVLIDSTQSGTRADGLNWVGSPILNVAGYVQNMPRDIAQMMTAGGSVSLNGSEVIVRSGAQLNLDGGFLSYQPGWVSTPNLLGANGRIYNIASADPNVDVVGFAGNFTADHARWGISENFTNPLLAGIGRWDPGFIVGSDAGALNINTTNALVLDGLITAQAFAGRDQAGQGKQPDGGSLSLNSSIAASTNRTQYAAGIMLQQSALVLEDRVPDFDAQTPWDSALSSQASHTPTDDDLRYWVPVSADMVRNGGFSHFTIAGSATGQITEKAGTQLSVMPGGSISLNGSHIDIFGSLSAPAGSIAIASGNTSTVWGNRSDPTLVINPELTPDNDITIGAGAVLSARGLWVNDMGKSADALIGDRYANGGSISLTAGQVYAPGTNRDGTGSVILRPGSTLDVSGGGYVKPSGEVELNQGVPVGHGGDIALQTYGSSQGSDAFNGSGGTPPPVLDSGALVLGGNLLGYGFSGGGTLTLQAASIQIGGDPSALSTSNGLYLDPSFFSGKGFDHYALTAVTDGIIAPGAQIHVSRQNLLPDYQALLAAPTGTDLYAADAAHPGGIYATVGALDVYHRYVTRDISAGHGPGFSLSAGRYLDWQVSWANPELGAPVYQGVSGSVVLGEGASIATDAGGDVALQGTQATTVLGSIDAPGGAIDLSTRRLVRGAGLPSVTPELWLGSSSVLDASGVSLINPWASAVNTIDPATGRLGLVVPRSGTVLDGGSVTLTANNGYLVAQQGSEINVSGASDHYDLPASGSVLGGTNPYVSTPVWSDAGSIDLAAQAGLFFDAGLSAHGGSAEAEGGSLGIVGLTRTNPIQREAPAATAIVFQSSGNLVPTGLAPGSAVESGTPSGVLHFAVDRLAGSGVTSVSVGPDLSTLYSSSAKQVVLPLAFAGDTNLTLGRSFTANVSALQALPAGATAPGAANGYTTGNANVQINAPYVGITGVGVNADGIAVATPMTPAALAGDGRLQVNADFIDLGGWLNLQRWANADFHSTGDIRFYETPAFAYSGGAGNAGLLFTTGNLQFQAAQIYPASDYAFIVDANASGLKDAAGQALTTTVTFLPNGSSTTPLSAGGALLVAADHIEQQGTLRVPSGTLALGVSDPVAQARAFGVDPSLYPLAVTQSVHLAPGSLTSVSLGGQTVPFGTTVDGVEWRYNGDPNRDSADLTAAPAKQIEINGSALSLDAGAGVDVSGGGHLQASEWVTGTGGSRDVLAQYQTSYENSTAGIKVPQYADGRAVYAIVPGYASPVAPHDAAFDKLGNAAPAVGQQVYLSGAPGLPAGYYTLLPAQYATLPGAYRVVQDTSATDTVFGRSAVQADGTLSVNGYFADALTGARGARNTTFLLQSESVWQQYSQYRLTDADTFFSSLATKAGQIAPPAVADAGRVALAATQSLNLGTTLTATPAAGGRGSLVDISDKAIEIVDAGQAGTDGYLTLSVDGLNALGAGSLLIGGSRQFTGSGYQVSVSADSVVLANDAAHPLQGPEVLLAADGNGNPGAQGVVLQGGSALAATGSGNGTGSIPLIFGQVAGTDAAGNALAAVKGDGALLRVSQNGTAAVVRNNTSAAGVGQLVIGAGARVDGGSALTLDASGATSVDPTAALSAQAIDSYSNQISFLGAGATLAPGTGGFVIGADTLGLLRNAQSLTLRSRNGISFYGNVDIDLPHDLSLSAGTFIGNGGSVTIAADRLSLSNDLGASSAAFSNGPGQFTVRANELDFGNGSTGLSGFGSFSATAAQSVRGQGNGAFQFGAANVSLATPLLLADNASTMQLTTSGALDVTGSAGVAPAGVMGGALQLTGGSVSIGTAVAAPAGNLDIEATNGDVTVSGGGRLSVAGINKTFYDTTTYAPGGALSITSDHGAVNLAPGSAIDFSGASAGGDAGSLTLQAGTQVALGGRLSGGAGSGYRAGYFTVGSGGALDLDALVDIAGGAGATGLFQASSGAGNLVLSAGHTLAAQRVYLNANGGGAGDAGGGQVLIDGTVNAAGASGSNISLYGNKGVDIEGRLIATSSIPAQRGGTVAIGTSGTPGGGYNGTYGYENVAAADSGYIHLGSGAVIDVSGGSSDSFSGGSVSMRAPLLSDGDVRIAVDNTSSIKGARVVTIEPYAIWSTKDTTSGRYHFDGVIDPAGWYGDTPLSGAPTLVAGQWADAKGNLLAAPTTADQLQQYLQNDYFIPTQANGDHAGFYGYIDGDASKGAGTLMGYVQQPGYTFGNRYAGIANVQLRPGIELDNPADGALQGKISVLTNWNLGAGTTQPDGSIVLAYRYQGLAPILTVRAAGDLDIQASITDGFYQQNSGAQLADPPPPPAPPAPPPSDNGYATALAAYQASQQYLDANNLWNGTINLHAGNAAQGYTPGGGKANITADPYYQAVQAPLTAQSANYYTNYEAYIGDIGKGQVGTWAYDFYLINNVPSRYFLAYSPTTLVAPQPGAYTAYTDYVSAYQSWLQSNFGSAPIAKRLTTPSPLLLPLDTDYTAYTTDYASYITGHKAYFGYVFQRVGSLSIGTQLFYAPFAPAADPVEPAYNQALTNYRATLQYLDANGIWNGTINLKPGSASVGYTPGGGKASLANDPYYQPLQAPLAGQSANYYTNYEAYIGEINTNKNPQGLTWAGAFAAYNNNSARYFLAYQPTPLIAPQPSAYTDYADYVSAYQAWLQGNFNATSAKRSTTPSPLLLPTDTDYTAYTSDYATYITGHLNYWSYVYNRVGSTLIGSQLFYAPFAPAANPFTSGGGTPPPPTHVDVPASAVNNSPSNMPSLGSPASLQSATLLGGSSSSYRFVAGAAAGGADPLATVANSGNVSFDGHFAFVDSLTAPSASPYNGKTWLFPTTVRTGSGSIDIASGGDIDWLDAASPAAVYTAGVPADGTTASTAVSAIRPSWIDSLSDPYMPNMLSTGQVNPVQGGDVSLAAQGDINAIQSVVDTTGRVTKGASGTDISQYWWQWMQTGNAADGSASSINFANFDQGVMSVGGNVSVTAGGDISQLSVSLPTTWYANASRTGITTVGGGNLSVDAGRNILSGAYFVAKGTADMHAGGLIGSNLSYTVPSSNSNFGGITSGVSTLLALQDAQFNVQARLGADIGGIYNPSYLAGGGNTNTASINRLLPAQRFDSQSYSPNSSVQVASAQGDVVLDSLSVPAMLFDTANAQLTSESGLNPGAILPSTIDLQALSGNVDMRGAGALYPSATGNLSMLAGENVKLSQQVYTMQANGVDVSNLGLIDASADLLPSALQPSGSGGASASNLWAASYLMGADPSLLHQADPLHADDADPVRIYAMGGDLTDGITSPTGFLYRSLLLLPNKPALVYAGRDVVNLSFSGQHLRDADVTRIVAGRDIYDGQISTNFFINGNSGKKDYGAYTLAPALLLGGPGSFLVQAGRNIGPLANQTEVAGNAAVATINQGGYTGIETIGNLINPYLPHESADIDVLYGVGPGMEVGRFIASYVDSTTDGVNLMPELVQFMERRVAGQVVDTGFAQDKLTVNLTPQQARELFGEQPDYVQRQFVSQSLFKILAQVGADYNDPSSPYYGKYARGYAAIGALFPASLGYTSNGAGQGGVNGAATTVDTGDLDIRSSTIQTQQGGDITILGPGGQALLGSTSAPPVITDSSGNVIAGPNSMGVLTLEKGDINIFTDRSVLLAQSRIFTEQGGSLVMWSSNGDINAGQGAKTTAEIPPPTYLCTWDAWCRIDARGQVSGAGIATLQTIPGAPTGNVYLIAPRGTVDAGDAGIRVSGNLIVAAAQVANADNIQVQGEKIGVPVAASVNVGALNAASAAANAVTKAVDDVNKQQQDDARNKLPSVISVQVLGFGDGTGAINDKDRRRRYDPNSPVQVLGAGQLSLRAKEQLTPEERARLAE
ncbi:filamentous hemagglutinin family N-terminal domain-containing protein [Dyella jiangningensis]|uniref:filamentous haemagglutinin family protein n=5 Tax=Gammaproteobacteria TaxID=1236 RepID=UPI00088E8223|nr:filamentous haemagglutinin family protein [Dyella sp. AtDHG13]PXV60283.1 filamentous hemagglutinin family protein [Dyella sp. AtDHG13]SDJ39206.1 filamentous hemagglutinin family N-terminal domain-containing protein [Dyella jiangningensis]